MKEITLRELMNMADQEAHDGIGNLWNDKTIHHLVIFTSADDDFEIIGVGPTLPYTSLDDAARHVVPGKVPEFFLKCPAANPNRLQPKLAPALKPAPARTATLSPIPASTPTLPPTPPAPEVKVDASIASLAESMLGTAGGTSSSAAPVASPSLKARTSAPFLRPAIKLGPRATLPVAPTAVSAETEKEKNAATNGATPANQPPTENRKPESAADLSERERAIAQREVELAALADALKIREASLREREAAIAAIEERLLNPARKSGG
jgi:hypothetical protein